MLLSEKIIINNYISLFHSYWYIQAYIVTVAYYSATLHNVYTTCLNFSTVQFINANFGT